MKIITVISLLLAVVAGTAMAGGIEDAHLLDSALKLDVEGVEIALEQGANPNAVSDVPQQTSALGMVGLEHAFSEEEDMSMEEVKDFMREVGWGTLATTDGERVGIRPMGGWAWIGRELWCASGASSEKIAHLRKVPYASYCFANQEGKHARIAGPCTVSTKEDDKLKLYDANLMLKNHIQDPASPEYVVIRLRPESIRFMKSMDMVYSEIKLD